MESGVAGASKPERGAAGPQRPGLLERLVDRIPLPYPAASFLLAVLFGPPGVLLLWSLEAGGPARAFSLFFHLLEPPTPWQKAAAFTLWTLLPFVLLLTARAVRRRVLDAEQALSPFLPDGEEAYRRAFAPLSRSGPPLLLALLLAAVFARYIQAGFQDSLGPVSIAAQILYNLFAFLVYGGSSWVYLAALCGLSRLGRRSLRLKPFHEDRMMGLRPAGSLSLSISVAFFAFLGILILVALVTPVIPEFLLLLAACTAVGVLLFFLPLPGLHRQMTEARSALRAAIHHRQAVRIEAAGLLAGPFAPAGAPPPACGEEATQLLREVLDLQALELAERKVGELTGWPFDTRILGRLSAAAVSVATGLMVKCLR